MLSFEFDIIPGYVFKQWKIRAGNFRRMLTRRYFEMSYKS